MSEEKEQKKRKTPTEKLKEELAQLKTQLENSEKELESTAENLKQQSELVLRTAAEFDNFKKRTEREKLRMSEFSKAAVIKQLLPTIDNAGRALSCEPGSEDYNKGIEMIAKQLVSLIDAFGLERLASEGDEFNPEIHEAVMHAESDKYEENHIAAVLQQGYKLGETVIRPAMVSVVK